jgi:hypothetical protein
MQALVAGATQPSKIVPYLLVNPPVPVHVLPLLRGLIKRSCVTRFQQTTEDISETQLQCIRIGLHLANADASTLIYSKTMAINLG